MSKEKTTIEKDETPEATKKDETIEEIVGQDGDEKSEDEKTEVTREKPKTKRGVVTDCLVLAVREDANIESKMIGTIDLGTEVKIDHENSTEDFYKIETKNGISGFSMKSFIRI
jgi:uncharacterized protein YgiM (DUF1202 family)